VWLGDVQDAGKLDDDLDAYFANKGKVRVCCPLLKACCSCWNDARVWRWPGLRAHLQTHAPVRWDCAVQKDAAPKEDAMEADAPAAE
jgi:hypothetical protein